MIFSDPDEKECSRLEAQVEMFLTLAVEVVVYYASDEECNGVRDATAPFVRKSVPTDTGVVVMTNSESALSKNYPCGSGSGVISLVDGNTILDSMSITIQV